MENTILKSENLTGYKLTRSSRVMSTTLREAQHIRDTHQTIRQTAEIFGRSKSCVHTDVTSRLRYIDPELYQEVQVILDENFAEKHLRGGEATRRKFAEQSM